MPIVLSALRVSIFYTLLKAEVGLPILCSFVIFSFMSSTNSDGVSFEVISLFGHGCGFVTIYGHVARCPWRVYIRISIFSEWPNSF